jgi:DNA-binding transcriptional MerR regulator
MNRLSTLGYLPNSTAMEGKVREPDPGEEELTISQMSRLYGVSLRTLRFYEDRALIKPRRDGSARYYRGGDRVRMDMILRGKKLGFTLSEISDLIGGKGASEIASFEERLRPQQIVNQIGHLERQREEIDSAISRLRATHTRLSETTAA